MDHTFQDVTKEYRRMQNLSVRGFAEALTEQLVNVSLSGETISKWENNPNRAPDLYLFLNCITTYTDWRAYYAAESLKAILPHVFDSGMVEIKLPKIK